MAHNRPFDGRSDFPFLFRLNWHTHTLNGGPGAGPEIEVIAADGRRPTSVKCWSTTIICHTIETFKRITPGHEYKSGDNYTCAAALSLARNYRQIVTVSNANIHSVQRRRTRQNRARPSFAEFDAFRRVSAVFAAGAECLVDRRRRRRYRRKDARTHKTTCGRRWLRARV